MNLHLSLHCLSLDPGASHRMPAGVCVMRVTDGTVEVAGNAVASGHGLRLPEGAALINPGDASATAIAVLLSEAPVDGAESRPIDVTFPCLLRLDEVAFPPGAIAYRHVHPGPGFRHLLSGSLHLQADDHGFNAAPGQTWFEPANSPVRATASEAAPETRFVRAMILPPEYRGSPTIQILDPFDRALPKQQVTHRHVDDILTQVSSGVAG